VRTLALAALAGCSWSTDLGVLHGNGGTGGSLDGHVGAGAVQREILVVDVSMRGDVATGGSRFAYGASVLGGLPIGQYHVLARAGVWNAPASTRAENTVVPTFELGGFIPLRADPLEPPSKYGWGASGIIFGVREDLDVSAYTTVFVGLQLFLIPGY
jgi:hypothetical protein